MSAPKNNNYAMKFKTSKERKELAHRYYLHCEKGLSNACFEIDENTLKKYISSFPEDFTTIKKSQRKRRLFWEELGINGAMGLLEGFNATTWIFNMKNRFGWRDNKEVSKLDDFITNEQIEQEEPKTTEQMVTEGEEAIKRIREALDAIQGKGKYAERESLLGERL